MSFIPDVSDQTVRRSDVAWHEEAGRVVITHCKFGPMRSRLLRLFRISPDLTLKLDPLGSEVWKLLDGRKVAEVLAALKAAHPEETAMAERLGRYLSTLSSNGLVQLSSGGTTN